MKWFDLAPQDAEQLLVDERCLELPFASDIGMH